MPVSCPCYIPYPCHSNCLFPQLTLNQWWSWNSLLSHLLHSPLISSRRGPRYLLQHHNLEYPQSGGHKVKDSVVCVILWRHLGTTELYDSLILILSTRRRWLGLSIVAIMTAYVGLRSKGKMLRLVQVWNYPMELSDCSCIFYPQKIKKKRKKEKINGCFEGYYVYYGRTEHWFLWKLLSVPAHPYCQ